MNVNTKYLREKRAKAHAAAVQFLSKGLTAENRSGYDRAMEDVETLGKEINALESNGRYIAPVAGEDREARAKHAFAFDKYLRGGIDALNSEERKSLNERSEKRDQTAGQITLTQSTGTAGGYLVPAGFADEIDIATKFYCPLMDSGNARTITTDSGAILPFPTNNDTGNLATLVAEGGGVTEQDTTFGNVNFSSYKYNSRVVKVTSELLQDSYFNIYSFLSAAFAERFGRAYEAVFTTGSGNGSAPTGFLTAIAGSGATPVTAAGSNANDNLGGTGANSIGTQDLVNLEHGVDPSYRRNAKYVMNDATLSFLQGMLDKFGRPIWTPGVASNAPDTINGYPYIINQSMPKISASNVTVAFGDWSKFIIRKVSTPVIKRLVELYAVSDDAIGFVAFQRVDSNLVDAGTHPLNVLQQHS